MEKEKFLYPHSTIVIGSSGFVGSKIISIVNSEGHSLSAPSLEEFDLLRPGTIENYLELHPNSVVINFAAFTDLAAAEKEKGDKKGFAWQLNVKAVEHLLDAVENTGGFFIHISTDAIFPGNKDFSGPYIENKYPPEDPTPLSWYGYTKLMGEKLLWQVPHAAVVRISYPFGNPNSRRDFVRRVIEYIKKGYSVFKDQYFTPTYLPNLNNALVAVASQRRSGIYHVTCSGLTTPLEFAQAVQIQLAMQQEVQAGMLENLKGVTRLAYGGLETNATQQNLSILFPTWQEALHEYINNNRSLLLS
jgi:dTDP-4-dehydrorhamnose reductase